MKHYSVLGYWWALGEINNNLDEFLHNNVIETKNIIDDCTTSNGCLWAVPGSHNLGVTRRFRRTGNPSKPTEFFPADPTNWDLTGAIPLEIPSGSLVLLHNAVVHYSEENKSPGKFK
jgi:ectoine hydroxylase-related dioxygenase (phytanoyl-CoA dioxygenase family)